MGHDRPAGRRAAQRESRARTFGQGWKGRWGAGSGGRQKVGPGQGRWALREFRGRCFEKSYYCINYSCSFLYKTVKIIIKISGVYLLWIFLHFCASYLYTKLCVPTTLLGLLMSPFLTATPHCQGLRWVIYNGANIINNMWIVIGTWLCANIMSLNKNTDS